MKNITNDIENNLFRLAGMVQKRQPELEVGDVVVSLNRVVAPEGSKGIVILKYAEDTPPDYDVYWYNSGVMGVIKEDVKCCEGMENKRLCGWCEYNDICPDLAKIVRCDISEFAEWRVEGERDLDVCRQRKCRHLSTCARVNWFPEPG